MDANELLRILRRARGERGMATVDVRTIEIVAAPEVVEKWSHMLEAVCTSLGPEELFLRSGYHEDEVRGALNFLG
ncbi:hypothetical protein ACFTY7_06820 [Streptomyces sp. NPDC057062]|uniref:hypothetical protein n=1 Tax=Streptomyces sp. NPDC057062 TaxID=3346011 RepID=UPI0036426662